MIHLASVEHHSGKNIKDIAGPDVSAYNNYHFNPETDISSQVKSDLLSGLKARSEARPGTGNYNYVSSTLRLYFNLRHLFPNEDFSQLCPARNAQQMTDILLSPSDTFRPAIAYMPFLFPEINIELETETLKAATDSVYLTLQQADDHHLIEGSIQNFLKLLLLFPEDIPRLRKNQELHTTVVTLMQQAKQELDWKVLNLLRTLRLLVFDEVYKVSNSLQNEIDNHILEDNKYLAKVDPSPYSEMLLQLMLSTAPALTISQGRFVVSEAPATSVAVSPVLPVRKEVIND